MFGGLPADGDGSVSKLYAQSTQHKSRRPEIGHIFESFSPTCLNLLLLLLIPSFFSLPLFPPSLLLCFLCYNLSPSVITHILPLQNRLSLANFLSGSTNRETGSELGCIENPSMQTILFWMLSETRSFEVKSM